MNVYRDINQLPEFKNAVITIGTFDGVHLGHKKVLEQLQTEAKELDETPVVITFYPHPKQVVASGKNPIQFLNTQTEKFDLLQKSGVENIVVVPFTDEFSQQSAESYIQDFLVGKFHPKAIIIGYDHRFGKGRNGNFAMLQSEAEKYDYEVHQIPEKVIADITISSTKVRDALLDGDLATASEFLGYDYMLSGTVIEGNKLGRTIGYPTANIQPDDAEKLIPANAVYAVDVTLENDDRKLKGMLNIGVRPTVNGTHRVIEVNIFDFDEMIYGKTLTLTFRKKLRTEKKFENLDALKKQLAVDKDAAQKANP